MINKIWFITGTSTGIGHELARTLINAGHQVVATARNVAQLDDLPTGELNQVLKLRVDITDQASIDTAVQTTIAKFGRIDVLVNNAGASYTGVVEESDPDAVRRLMEVNFWGPNNVMRTVLPYMRKAHAGRIINTSSSAGLQAPALWPYYAASKFALEGLFAGLRAEVAEFGIQVTNVEPGFFRTELIGTHNAGVNETIPDYAQFHEQRAAVEQMSGQQPGNPVLAAKLYMHIAELDNAPLNFLFGADAYDSVVADREEQLASFKANQAISTHGGFGDESFWD